MYQRPPTPNIVLDFTELHRHWWRQMLWRVTTTTLGMKISLKLNWFEEKNILTTFCNWIPRNSDAKCQTELFGSLEYVLLQIWSNILWLSAHIPIEWLLLSIFLIFISWYIKLIPSLIFSHLYQIPRFLW